MTTLAAPSRSVRRTRRRRSRPTSPEDAARREALLSRVIEVVDHPCFHEPNAEALVSSEERVADGSQEGTVEEDAGRRADLPGHLRALCGAPLLSREAERAAFLRFNWERHNARLLQERLRAGDTEPSRLDELEAALARVDAARNAIVVANTRLVVAVARTFVGPGLGFDDLLAAGMPPLIRSVELFDVGRGYRFSTYATWAVRNHFLRVRQRHQTRRSRFRTGEEESLREIETPEFDAEAVANGEAVARRTVDDLLGELDDRDRTIVEARFGLNGHGDGRTFSEIGSLVGLSKERVRQLTQRALERLRESRPDASWIVGA